MTRWIKVLLALSLCATLAACAGRTAGPSSTARSYGQSAPPKYAQRDAKTEFAEALNHMNMGNTDQAIEAFASLTKAFPRYTGPWTNLGIIHAKAQRYDQAYDAFQSALRAKPSNAIAMNWLGYICVEKGLFEQARGWYERALAVKPDYESARLNLAMVYDTGLRQPDQALEHYRRYQESSNDEHLIVDAWIKSIENDRKSSASVTGVMP